MDFNILLMQMACIWPLNTRNLLHIFLQRLLTWFTLFVLAFVSVTQLLKLTVSLDLQELSSTIDVFTLTASALYKLIYLLTNMHTLQRMVNVVHQKFEEKPLMGIDKFNMQSYIKPTRILCILYVASGQVASFVWNFAPLLIPPVEPIKNIEVPLTLKNRKIMPMNIWLPFNIANSPAYEILWVIEAYSFCSSAFIYLTIDCFYFYLIHIICGQLKLLDASFRTLFSVEENMQLEEEERAMALKRERNLEGMKEIENMELVKKKETNQSRHRHDVVNQHLDRMIDHHATILDLIRLIEVFFSQAIVVDFLHAILSLSFALFQTQMSVTFMEAIKMYIFIVVCIVHQFFNNYFGEEIIHAQHKIVNSVYEAPWYTGDRKFKRSVQMIVTRSHRPIKLSGFKMYILCLQSFVEVIYKLER
ncbi:hypothetical protein WDU94_001947 [Cyamophila willieti]